VLVERHTSTEVDARRNVSVTWSSDGPSQRRHQGTNNASVSSSICAVHTGVLTSYLHMPCPSAEKQVVHVFYLSAEAPSIATQLNSTGRPVELSCVAINGALGYIEN